MCATVNRAFVMVAQARCAFAYMREFDKFGLSICMCYESWYAFILWCVCDLAYLDLDVLWYMIRGVVSRLGYSKIGRPILLCCCCVATSLR